MSTLTLVVGGAPALADALTATRRFATVHSVSSTGELRQLVSAGTLPSDKTQLVFLFADNLNCDTPQMPLEALVGKLTLSGWKVVILALTPAAQQLVAGHRQAGMLEGPFTVNSVLGAVAGTGLALVDPLPEGEGGFESFHPVSGPSPVKAAGGAAGWETVHAPWGGWGSDTPSEQPPTPAPAPAQPAAPAPAPAPAPTAPAAWEANPAPAHQPQRRSLSSVVERADAPDAAPGWDQAPEPAAAPGWQTPDDTWGGPGHEAAAPVARGGPAVQPGLARARRGHVITISTSKGGTGKSSLSLNLAAFLGMRLKEQGKTVAIIDANAGQADIAKMLDVYSPNITDIVKDPSALTIERISQFLVHRPELNLSALLGPPNSRDANPVYITPQLYNQVLDLMVQLYDYVICDTQVAEAHSPMHVEFAINRADFLIVPITPNLMTLMNADSWLRDICKPKSAGGVGFDEERIGVVLNMEMAGVELDADDVMTELGSWSFIGSIPFTPVWQLAINRNELVATYNYAELNQAFSSVLYAATGEPVLVQAAPQAAPAATGVKDKLANLLRRRK